MVCTRRKNSRVGVGEAETATGPNVKAVATEKDVDTTDLCESLRKNIEKGLDSYGGPEKAGKTLKELESAAAWTHPSPWLRACYQSCGRGHRNMDFDLGGREGIAMKLRMMQLDENGDGKFSVDELDVEKHEKIIASSMEGACGLLTSCGVVAALVLSLVAPLNFQPVDACNDTMVFFGDVLTAALSHCFTITLLMTTFAAILTMALAARQYHMLTNWMVDVRCKMWFLGRGGQAVLASLMLGMMGCLLVCMPFGVVLAKGPYAGAYACGLAIASFAAYTSWERYFGDPWAIKLLLLAQQVIKEHKSKKPKAQYL